MSFGSQTTYIAQFSFARGQFTKRLPFRVDPSLLGWELAPRASHWPQMMPFESTPK